MKTEHIFLLIKCINPYEEELNRRKLKFWKISGSWSYLIEIAGKFESVRDITKEIILDKNVISYQVLQISEEK